MTSNKHEQTDVRDNPLPNDLEKNPGIGQSKGSFSTGEDPELIEGENTVEGDTGNNAGRFGEVKTDPGRTNK